MRLKTAKRADVVLKRGNLLTLMYLVGLEEDELLSLIEVNDDVIRFQSGNEPVTTMNYFSVKLLYDPRIRVLEVSGLNVLVEVKSYGFSLSGPIDLVLESLYELFSEFFYPGIDVRDKVVVDVGGFIGDSAAYFAAQKAKFVYVFEPSGELAELARRNTSQFGNVIVKNYGLGPADQKITFLGYAGRSVGEIVQIRNGCAAIQDIIDLEGRIDLLKIDCEGCEWELLAALGSLLDCIPAIYLEIHGKRHDLLLSPLETKGFELKRCKNHPKDPTVALYLLERAKKSPVMGVVSNSIQETIPRR